MVIKIKRMAASEPTFIRFVLAVLVAAFVLTAHVEHLGVLDLVARIGGAPVYFKAGVDGPEETPSHNTVFYRVKAAVFNEIRTAHTLCNESSRGLFVEEPQLASAYPWHLVGYIMSWRWVWNGAYSFANALLIMMPMFNFWRIPSADIHNCMLKHIDSLVLLYCYKYMLTAIIVWRKPPLKIKPAPAESNRKKRR